MRYILLSFCLLLTGLAGNAQNEWFISFGKTKDEVHDYLSEKDYFKFIKIDDQMERVLAVLDEGNQIEYVFHSGKLFATSMRKEYPSKDEAKQRLQNCLEYMDAISKDDIVRTSEGPSICYTASAKKRIVKLFVMPQSTSKSRGQILQLTSISSAYAHKMGDNKLYTDTSLMTKKSKKNRKEERETTANESKLD